MNTRTRLLSLALAASLSSASAASLEDFLKKHGDAYYATFESVSGDNDKLHLKSADLAALKFKVSSEMASIRNLLGSYSGSFTMGAVSTNNGIESLNLTGEGKFSVADGLGKNLEGLIQEGTLRYTKTGNVASLDLTLTVKTFTYSGTNEGLLRLKNAGGGSFTLPLDASGLPSLAQLKQESGFRVAGIKSGTFESLAYSAIPEPATYGTVLAFAMIAVVGLRRRSTEVA